jgi:apolipoprotein D and lipocalin family protein
MFKTFALLTLLSTLLLACASTSKLPPQPTVAHVDIPRFMGKWYVIASIPTSFEKNAHNATETYTWNEKEQRIDVDFRFLKESFKGEEKKIPQKGFIYNQQTKAEWRIQPFWPLKFAYLIVGLADDYSDTIIGVPDRGNVWIMARAPSIAPARYDALVAQVKAFGYDVTKLKLVPQKW